MDEGMLNIIHTDMAIKDNKHTSYTAIHQCIHHTHIETLDMEQCVYIYGYVLTVLNWTSTNGHRLPNYQLVFVPQKYW